MGRQRNLTSEVSRNPEVDMSQTLVVPGAAASRGDVFPQALVRSWEDRGSDVAWVQMAGELDIASAPALERALRDAEHRSRLVVLDLRELTFTDTSGVHVISQATIHARAAARRLVVVRGPAQVDRMFGLTTSNVLEIVDLDLAEPVVQTLLQLAQGRGSMRAPGAPTQKTELTVAISAAMVGLYAALYGRGDITATTYVNDKIVACVLEHALNQGAASLLAAGAEAIDDRVGFDAETEDEFCAAIERVTRRRVVAFMSQDQSTPGVACELFFLDAAPLAAQTATST
jgi:anti-anti-sigma factor